MSRVKLAIVGLGKIARDQHIPACNGSDEFELVAVASPGSTLDGVRSFPSLAELLEAVPDVTAVALCTPPQVRYETARYALEQGRHVLLEKPPGITVGEIQDLAELALSQEVTLFAAWHSRHAPAVEPARAWLAQQHRVRSVKIIWKEDVRVWHPGQRWIWQPGGLGVFDPGINALSILTHIIPGVYRLSAADLSYPSNCETPIAAHLLMFGPRGIPANMELDFLYEGNPCWDIVVETDHGRLHLSKGGNQADVDGQPLPTAECGEYASLYARFAELVRERRLDVDISPLQMVADAFLSGRRVVVGEFKG
jgi:D-galactose 1-dehydrogenase